MHKSITWSLPLEDLKCHLIKFNEVRAKTAPPNQRWCKHRSKTGEWRSRAWTSKSMMPMNHVEVRHTCGSV